MLKLQSVNEACSHLQLQLFANVNREFEYSQKDAFLLCNENEDKESQNDMIVCLHSVRKSTATLRFNLRSQINFKVNLSESKTLHRTEFDDEYTQYFVMINLDELIKVETPSFSAELQINKIINSANSAKIGVRAIQEVRILRLSTAHINDSNHPEFCQRKSR